MVDTSTTAVERMAVSMEREIRKITRIDDLKSNEAEMLRDLAKERDAAHAEIERLTKALNENKACNRGLVRLNEAVVARAEKAEAERDEHRADAIQARLERNKARASIDRLNANNQALAESVADAERDMRQRAAEYVETVPMTVTDRQEHAKAIRALPLKHEGGV